MPQFPDDYFTAIIKGVPHGARRMADCADLSDLSEQFEQWVKHNTSEELETSEMLEAVLQAYTGWLRKHGYMRDQRKWVSDLIASAIAEQQVKTSA